MYSKTTLIGNLGKDPETRYTKDRKPVCTFSVATTETFNNEKKTTWHNIVAFGKLAEICQQYLVKGKQVFIEGKIDINDYEDKEGNKKRSINIICSAMKMLGSNENRTKKQENTGIMTPEENYGGVVGEDVCPF